MTRVVTKHWMPAALLGVALLAAPATARADHHRDWDDWDRSHLGIGFHTGSAPVYAERPQRVWVAPVYQTVTERVWVPETAQTVMERTWCPPRYGWQDVEHRDRGHRWYSREYILIERGHFEQRPRQVITPAHYEDRARQMLVTPGHWETRVERYVVPGDGPDIRFNLRLPLGH